MTESKRDSNGRFKSKTRKPKEPTNPDCEPETKGFVKCIVRKILYRDVKGYSGSAFIWLLLTVLFTIPLVTCGGNDPHAWIFGCMIMISLSLAAHDQLLSIHKGETVEEEYLQKYQPPTCEKKNECE